ncbi:MAG: prenyltransferase [Euryarchaeota archaeon]|nr:prenyltransferase [Euryarchaeota archaeon]
MRSGIDTGALLDFVRERRKEDGGFAFVPPLPSSMPETYYGVFILKALGEEVDAPEALEEFLLSKLDRSNIYSWYYALETLALLGTNPELDVAWLVERLDGVLRTYSFAMPRVLEDVFYMARCLDLVDQRVPSGVTDFIRSFKREGGGYGVRYPNLRDTFYALSCLQLCNRAAEDVKTRHFLEGLQHPGGGFVKSAGSYPPYLEDTFFGQACVNLVKGRVLYPEETRDMVARLQTRDGGFRRGIYGGIATLEGSYYAVACLKGSDSAMEFEK